MSVLASCMVSLGIFGYSLAGCVLFNSGKNVEHDSILLVHEQL